MAAPRPRCTGAELRGDSPIAVHVVKRTLNIGDARSHENANSREHVRAGSVEIVATVPAGRGQDVLDE